MENKTIEKTISLQDAITFISTAKSVHDWNAKREQLKDAVGYERWLRDFVIHIDGSGLITKVLK
jgi:hypothetical protein